MSTMRVNRENLLQILASVQAGLSQKESTDQSDAFVFSDGEVITFNDELACTAKCDIGFEGAIRAASFLAILGKLDEDEIKIESGDGELIIKGKRRKAGLKIEADILMPIDAIEEPEEWLDLNPDFIEALHVVQQCISGDESKFALTCVHIHPNWIEACDSTQLLRYRFKTGVKKSVLLRGISSKNIAPLSMTEISHGENWLHFRNSSDVVLSCRLFLETFPDMKHIFEHGGEKFRLPKGLKEATEKAEVFSSESSSSNLVQISLRPGRVTVRGSGTAGWYSEKKKSDYEGKPLSFLIAPSLIEHITSKYSACLISEKFLTVETKKFTYVTCIGAVNA